jgi:hypothetical protein
MPHQYKREPLTADEAPRLANAYPTHQEKLEELVVGGKRRVRCAECRHAPAVALFTPFNDRS